MTTTESETVDDAQKQTTLSGDVKVGGNEIEAVPENSETDILGWTAILTIGNDFVVPRNWLEKKAREVGLEQSLLPRETTRKRAYNRATSRLTDEERSWDKNEDVEVSLYREGHSEYHLEVTDRRDNDVSTTKLGSIVYNTDTDPSGPEYKPGNPVEGETTEVDMTKGSNWYFLWVHYVDSFKNEFQKMLDSNLGIDLRTAMTDYFNNGRAVKMRNGGAVYFAPKHTEATTKAWKEIAEGLNEFKDNGFRVEFDLMKVQNAEEERQTVERRAEDEIKEEIESVVQDAVEALDEDELTDEVIGELKSELDGTEAFAQEYNRLLDAELAVEQYLQDWKNKVADNAESVVEELMESR